MNTPASNTVHEISPCSWLVKTTEQHVLLSSTFCAQLGKLYTSPRIRASCFQSLGECPHNPFRDDEPVAGFTRETSANDSQILEDLNGNSFPRLFQAFRLLGLPLSRFRDESTSPRMFSAALPQRYEDSYLKLLNDFRGTTLLNSFPLLVERHVIRMTPSQSRFSLSKIFIFAQEPVIPPEFSDPRTWVTYIFKER